MGNEQATPKKRFQMAARHAHGGEDSQGKRERKGWILEVYLEYPAELQQEHNSYPLAPEKKVAKKKWMSDYQKILERPGAETSDSENLLLSL